MRNKLTLSWFLLGLGSKLQIISSLSFTELFVYTAAPIILFKEYQHLKKNGMLTFFYLSVAVACGCFIASMCNHTRFDYFLRGMAVTTLLPCTIIVGHWMLRRDMAGFKWMLVGGALSSILCTFMFQQAVEVSMLAGGESGASAVQSIMSGPIFWISRLNATLLAIPKGWYINCPMVVSAGIPLFMAAFSVLTSASGRSAALGALATVGFVLLGGRKPSTIRRNICNRFWILIAMGIFGIFLAKFAYQTSAEQGWLGEKAQKKYESQTKGDKSMKALILGGRMASFCGLIACVDRPIIGFGPWAKDEGGYVDEFLRRYANAEDYEDYIATRLYYHSKGMVESGLIPGHAYITEFWLWYGIFGLLFWLYVMFVLLRYLKEDCWAVPQWYMWLAASIPGYFWGIFFSPWGDRVFNVTFVVACLMARAVRQGRQCLSQDMLREIELSEGRKS